MTFLDRFDHTIHATLFKAWKIKEAEEYRKRFIASGKVEDKKVEVVEKIDEEEIKEIVELNKQYTEKFWKKLFGRLYKNKEWIKWKLWI